MFKRIPFNRVIWVTSTFLMVTLLITLTVLPVYLWHYGLNWFQAALFLAFYIATGLSITLGYHRLFSHLSFKAKWPVKLFTLIFGSAAFENSAYDWVSDHRRHHKFVDQDEDPYDITKGFMYAHMGWMMFKLRPDPPQDNVADLEKDPMVMWQHRYTHIIGIAFGFGLPTLIGAIFGWFHYGTVHAMAVQALGAFLIAGVLRIVCVQHSTFFINSLCHTLGRRPYSTRCTARDSGLVALVTFGEGYHNFHHEFQHDYRNGVKAWQFDPTKWSIWTLSKLGLASDLRRVPASRILLAEVAEAHRELDANLEKSTTGLSQQARTMVASSIEAVQEISQRLAVRISEMQTSARGKMDVTRETLNEWRRQITQELRAAREHLELIHAHAAAVPVGA
jgi:stearoyl-CoA desaturase (Delta-9 desaturase)